MGNKCYLVYESWCTCDDSSVIGVFLDKDKAEEYIRVKNIDRKKEEVKHEKCALCVEYTEGETCFKLKDICEEAKILKDRHGDYCENDMSDYYQAISTNSYWIVESELR